MMAKIASREETVKLIKKQLDDVTYTLPVPKAAWHYGRVELKELLDFIYGEEPKNKNEELTSSYT